MRGFACAVSRRNPSGISNPEARLLFPIKEGAQVGLIGICQMHPCVLVTEGPTGCILLRRLGLGNWRWIGKQYPPPPTTFLLVVTHPNSVVCGGAAPGLANAFQKDTLLFTWDKASPCCTGRDWTKPLSPHHILVMQIEQYIYRKLALG